MVKNWVFLTIWTGKL